MNKYQEFTTKKVQNGSWKQNKIFICYLNDQKAKTKEFCKRHHIEHIELTKHPWVYVKKWKAMFLLQHNHKNQNTDNNKWAYKFDYVNKLTNKKEMCILRIDRNRRGIRNIEDIAFLESQHQLWENNKRQSYYQYIEIFKHLNKIQKIFDQWIKQQKAKK